MQLSKKRNSQIILLCAGIFITFLFVAIKMRDNLFLRAVKHGDAGQVFLMLRLGANPKPAIPFLPELIYADKLEVVAELLKQDIDIREPRIIHAAVAKENLRITKRLLALGADPNANWNGTTPLTNTGAGVEMTQTLLDAGVPVNARGYDNVTALIRASSQCQTESVHLLLARGADVNLRTNSDISALESVLTSGIFFYQPSDYDDFKKNRLRQKLTSYLQERSFDWRLKTQKERLEIVPMLIKAGADVNQQNKDGTTPLMRSIYGLPEMTKLLLEMGADVTIRDNKNRDAITVAKELRRDDIIPLLKRRSK